MELKLDRKLAERRTQNLAIDADASSTRHEELFFAPAQLNLVWKLSGAALGPPARAATPGRGWSCCSSG